MAYRHVGVMHFWRIGRIGGSFYIAKKRRKPRNVVLRFGIVIALCLWFVAAFTN